MGIVGLALFVQAYDLTGSPATLGYLGLVQFLAMLVGMLGGSAIVDHIDRRLLLLLTHVGFGLSVAALLIGSLFGDPPIALPTQGSAVDQQRDHLLDDQGIAFGRGDDPLDYRRLQTRMT
jgi:ENTS family enterobactin (siderophore) exporter